MHCPNCGTELKEHTAVCTACGAVFLRNGTYYVPPTKSTAKPATAAGNATTSNGVALEKPARFPRLPLIILLVFALAIAAVIAVPLVQEQMSLQRDIHRVTFVMKTPGYNDEATAIPVKITGTQADGASYAETIYLDGGGNGVALEPGSYSLTFPGGSILPNGTVLVAPADTVLGVEVPTGLARNAFVQLPADQAVNYTAVAPLDLTDETLSSVYEAAAADPADNGKAAQLRDNALKAHEEAVAQKEADNAALEKKAKGTLTASVGDEAQFVGTLSICSAEEAGERLGDSNVQWNLYGHTLAILWLDEPRTVRLETTTSGYYGYYDNYGYWHDSDSYTDTREYEVTCLVLNNDVEGVYTWGAEDDGTLAAHDGKRVLATGKLGTESDWSTSQISPITLVNPTLKDV